MSFAARALAGTLAAAALTGFAVAAGRARFRRKVAAEVAALFAGANPGGPALLPEADIAHLPEPVQRWLRYARVTGKERPRTVRLRQRGEFRLGEGQGWMPFEAEQYYTTDPPGFVWSAEMQMTPLLTISVRDRYLMGRGSIEARVLGLLPMANASGPELDLGVLLRYLNEMMWFPAAALDPYIRWEALDADAARATMTYAGISASAVFFFDEEGKLTTMEADRYRDMGGGKFVLQTWATPVTEYGEFNGIRVPVAGEGIWKTPVEDFCYIRLRITALEYNRATTDWGR